MRTLTNEKTRCILVYIYFYKAGKNIFSFEYISKSTSRIERSRNYLQSVWSLQTSPYEIRLQTTPPRSPSAKSHPCLIAVPPSTTKIFPRRLCVPCGFIVSPTTLRCMTSTQKGVCMYVLHYVDERKRAQGVTAF